MSSQRFSANPDKHKGIGYHHRMERQDEDWDRKSDEQLMAAYQEGAYAAFEEIYRRYSGRIYGYLRKKLGEQSHVDDLFQVTFQKLHKSRHRYKSNYALKAWLFTICHNVLTDFFRGQGRSKEISSAAIHIYEAQPAGHEPIAGVDGLDKLPFLQKQALQLRFEESLPFDEIAHEMSISSSYARQLVARAVHRLRKTLSARRTKEE